MKCKVCNKDLFVELDFRTLFLPNYKVHKSCESYLDLDVKTEVIPIENNTIQWHYFIEEDVDVDEEFVEMYLIGKSIKKCLENLEWSMVVWMSYEEYIQLDDLTQFLFLKMGDQSIVFLSLFSIM